MAAAFGRLRLSPRTFWSMTPVELERALSSVLGDRTFAPRRKDLAALMHAFPDGG